MTLANLQPRGAGLFTDPFCINEQNVNGKYKKTGIFLSKGWMSVSCTEPSVVNLGGNFRPDERWDNADATAALYWAWICYARTQNFSKNPTALALSFSQTVSNFLNGPDGFKCELLDESSCNGGNLCKEEGHAAG